jgi:gliding motility-associated-like protein
VKFKKEMTAVRTLFLITLLSLSQAAFAQFKADAGQDKYVCPDIAIVIGGSPSAFGGYPPYKYSWQPSTALSSATDPNPLASPSSNITYTLTVTDDSGQVRSDIIQVFLNPISYVTAGRDTSICENSNSYIGSFSNPPGITYSWSPGATLNDSTIATPTAYPGMISRTYTVTATTTGCNPKTDQVNVYVIPTPPISAGPDVTIKEGEVAILTASGAYYYSWGFGNTLNYIYSESCDAEPKETTTYYLGGTDETNKCPAYDEVTVFVEPSDEVVIYNTFTPNGDGNNDNWYIGNLYKYPDNILEVYNRYGKLVYRTSEYTNNWDGKVSGEELPAGTYFYDLNLGKDGKKHHGTITIIR